MTDDDLLAAVQAERERVLKAVVRWHLEGTENVLGKDGEALRNERRAAGELMVRQLRQLLSQADEG